MKHDGTINLAQGMSAKSKTWKNKEWTWSDIAAKLQEAHKTNETFKEFMLATKEERSKIKDVGGYVGGYLRNGRRKPENVVHRQLLTLDIDFANVEFWDDFCLQFDNAAVLHATHTHSAGSPRYRLVMPLDREATPDEYVAVARQVAGILGIDLFDNTTFETNRLMFWPSSPKDVDYYCETQDGPWVNVDETLDTYIDWKDSSLWPTSTSNLDKIKDASAKQEDPESKKGIIGAFCRAYGVTEAIDTFLKETYISTLDGRYTYAKGTAASGLVIYDDKFAFSHHGTDPCGGKLCNAFDLVRIHLFGHLDSGPLANNVKLKSFKAMEDFAREDRQVRGVIAEENIAEAKYEFAEELSEELSEELEAEGVDWAKELEVDGKGKYLSTANNLNIIFANDPRLKDIFKQNDFDGKRYVFRSLPWRKITKPETMKNVDYSGVRNYIESIYGITGNLKIDDSLALEFEKQSFHPIKEYIDALEWDGKKRVDTLLIDYFGATDNIYTRESIRKMLVGAVARVYRPGVKFDLVLTLVGEQGNGKSMFISKLGHGWFSDTFMTVQGKEALEQIQGAWLIEMAELSALRKAEVEAVKHFISKQEDTFRPAYARASETFKRQCVFFGTTNKVGFLNDPSGNRRFMPIDTLPKGESPKSPFSRELDEQVGQIWAEAREMYRSGEKLYLSDAAELIAKQEQTKHREADERQGLIENFLDQPLPKDWAKLNVHERRDYLTDELSSGKIIREFVCVAEIWCECLAKEKTDMSRYNTRELNDILRGLDEWEQSQSTKNFPIYGKQKFYTRKLL